MELEKDQLGMCLMLMHLCSIFMKCPPIRELCMLLGACTWTNFKANEVEETNVRQAPEKR
jgi:hypothetical protein